MAHRFLVGHVQSAKVRSHSLNRGHRGQRHSSLGVRSREDQFLAATPRLVGRLLANHRDGAIGQSLLHAHIRRDILGMIARGGQALDREGLARKVEREAILDALVGSGRCSVGGLVGHIIGVVDYCNTLAEIL